MLILKCTSCSCSSARGRALVLVPPSLALFSSTPSLAGTQQHHHHLRFHQQECGSAAAAAPTVRMRRVQQPMLHVSSSISCNYVISVSVLFVLPGYDACEHVCVGACESVCWNPTFQLFFCFSSACCCCLQLRTLVPCVCGPLLCMFGHHDVCVYALFVLRVRTATVQQHSHSKFVYITSMRVLTLHIHA